MRDLSAVAKEDSNHWVPIQDLPFDEIIFFAYAADHSSRPTYVCLPSGLYHARSGQSCSFFFFLEFGRCRAKARSLHEHKLSKRRLYKDTVGPYEQANRSQKTKKRTNHQTTTTRKSPSQTCVSPEETAKQTTTNQTQTKKGAGAQTKHPQNRFAKGHSGLTTASASKTCDKNELRTTTFKQT